MVDVMRRLSGLSGLSALVALLGALSVGCVDASDHLSRTDPTSVATSSAPGGLPQRLWMRYAMRDINGNPLPAIYGDSTGASYRVYADTLSFAFATGEFSEVAIVARIVDNTPDQPVRIVSKSGLSYVRTPAELVRFPSVLFGASTGTLSGATRVQPFSPILSASPVPANYVWY